MVNKLPFRVGILIFEGFEPLGLFGPGTVFGAAHLFGPPIKDPPLFQATILGEDTQPMASDWGP
jgi:hypothetical protein